MSSDVSIDIDIDDDESIKILAALFGNQTSRDIIKLLVHDKMYSSEICQKLGIKTNTIVPHLKRLKGITNLLKITNEKIIKNGTEHQFFHILPSKIVFVLKKPKKDESKRVSKKIFKEGVKFASIGILSVGTYLLTRPTDELVFTSDEAINLTYPLLIISVFLIAERVFSVIKKRKNFGFNRK